MSAQFSARSELKESLLRPSVFAAGIALLVTLFGGIFAESQNRAIHEQNARAEVGEQLSMVRARLEKNINSNIQLVRGLVAVIEARPEMDQQEFSAIAAGLIGDHSQLRNIAAAPDLVISLMHPIEGNERAIGLDYRKNEIQREAAMRAVTAREMILAGPVQLLQGGEGFIGRFPVFIRSQGTERLWGLVSAVVDVEQLYADSGLRDPDLPIEIAIAGRDATGEGGEIFFGSEQVFDARPVLSDISLPSGSWRIAAIPEGGWSQTPPNVWQIRLLILIAGLLLVLPISIAGYLYDQRRGHVREIRRRQKQLEKLSQRLKLALETSRIGVWELNLDNSELFWDDRMRELYGVPEDQETVGYETWARALHPDDRKQAERDFDAAIAAGGTYSSEFRVVLGDGSVRWIRAMGAVSENEASYILGVNWDVSADIELKTGLLAANRNADQRNRELEDARAQMEHASLHDSLTGLPNRRFLDEHLLNPESGRKPTALLHIDLDRFKHINDTLGHAAGDFMLVHAASILRKSTRETDFVARIGGDEFVIATTDNVEEEELAGLATRIIEKICQPVPFENHDCRIGVSIGIATADTNRPDYGKQLLIDADIALYRAKRNGRNRYEFFSDTLRAEIVHTKQVADDILNGLEREEFVPHFQPQFDARTLKVVGTEALARWRHPTRGTLTPDAFLKTAEELNVVPLIDRTILEQTLWQSARWRAAGIEVPRVSVNVSAGRLYDPKLIDSLDGLPIEPGMLSFELLESTFLDDRNEIIARNFERLKEMGIDIEIDDFGTGYASIVSLINLRPARLKIDRRLILPLAESDAQRRLVASIIEIGHSLGIEVTAEGVETRKHADILRDLGCDFGQGFLFAKALSPDDIAELMSDGWPVFAGFDHLREMTASAQAHRAAG